MTDGTYDLVDLHLFLIKLKQKHKNENSIILEPIVDLTYEELIAIMDSVRMFKNTDESIYKNDKDGIDVKLDELFGKIVFGNIQS